MILPFWFSIYCNYLLFSSSCVFFSSFSPSFVIFKWGGISSEEHDEAVMLEAAMFGGIPEGTAYNYAYGPHQFMRGDSLYPRVSPRPPSPSLEAQRLIREQQV